MAFDLHIRNIGKLKDAKISIGQFTVLAGPNNTGKSYASKLLYSFFNAARANLVNIYVDEFIECLEYELVTMKLEATSLDINSETVSLYDKIGKLKLLTNEVPRGKLEPSDDSIHNIVDEIKNIKEMFVKLCSSHKNWQEDKKTDKDQINELGIDLITRMVDEYLNTIEHSLTRVRIFPIDEFHYMGMDSDEAVDTSVDLEKMVTFGLEHEIEKNLVENFQIPHIFRLMYPSDDLSDIHISGIGKFSIAGDLVKCDVDSVALKKLRQYSNVIYLESPAHWRLKSVLENHPPERLLGGARGPLSGVPGHLFDMVKLLRQEYTGRIAFPELHAKLTGGNILGGKMTLSEGGSLQFREDERNRSLSETSMGIVNLGMLALLIERKVLNEKSFLFIDEPETNLHPAWQVTMAKTLFELAKGGVNVVIATHSIEILKWLEVHIKRHPEDEKLVALNKFSDKGANVPEQNFIDKISAIKEELTKPFAKLYTAGL